MVAFFYYLRSRLVQQTLQVPNQLIRLISCRSIPALIFQVSKPRSKTKLLRGIKLLQIMFPRITTALLPRAMGNIHIRQPYQVLASLSLLVSSAMMSKGGRFKVYFYLQFQGFRHGSFFRSAIA